ncbi:MAG: SGNH/GDSL hydrolase family protein [Streptosporangiaceae bacterium]|nr:SGNH/GDSL hydrolase family protein [Streptosporangiaceae bacterium]
MAAALCCASVGTAVCAATAGASPTGTAAAVNYVALGDSYSSGLGAGNDIAASGRCSRSSDAYPEQWATAHSPASFASAACAGATTSDVLARQIAALSRRTTLVSITIGGNDAGFAAVMEACVLLPTGACLGAVSAAEAFIASQLPGRLDATLRAIRTAAPDARVIVLGYPHLYDLAASAGCIGLSTADRAALNTGADDLDAALAAAAAANGDTFADVRGQFAGHEICDSGSWLHSVDILALSSSYHPTAAGQVAGYLPVFAAAVRSR